jgi:hypothetical protein
MVIQWLDPQLGGILVQLSAVGDVSVFFDGEPDAFAMKDFKVGSRTWTQLYALEQALIELAETREEVETWRMNTKTVPSPFLRELK